MGRRSARHVPPRCVRPRRPRTERRYAPRAARGGHLEGKKPNPRPFGREGKESLMRKRLLPLLFVPLALAAILVITAAAPSGAGYEVKGKYYETCACAVSCPCAANATLPTEGHCDAGMVFHIDKGSVEGVPMDGLDIVMVIKSPHGKKVKDSLSKGDMDLVSMYLDDKANEKQKGA